MKASKARKIFYFIQIHFVKNKRDKDKSDFNFLIRRYSMAYNTSKVVHYIFKQNMGDKFLENVLSYLFAA